MVHPSTFSHRELNLIYLEDIAKHIPKVIRLNFSFLHPVLGYLVMLSVYKIIKNEFKIRNQSKMRLNMKLMQQ